MGGDLWSTRIGLRGGSTVKRGWFVVTTVALAMAVILLVAHRTFGSVVVGLLAILLAACTGYLAAPRRGRIDGR